MSIKLPVPLAHLANTRHGRYILTARIAFAHRGAEWADRIAANRAVAYRIHLDTERGRWYLTASWQRPVVQTIPLETARARSLVGGGVLGGVGSVGLPVQVAVHQAAVEDGQQQDREARRDYGLGEHRYSGWR